MSRGFFEAVTLGSLGVLHPHQRRVLADRQAQPRQAAWSRSSDLLAIDPEIGGGGGMTALGDRPGGPRGLSLARPGERNDTRCRERPTGPQRQPLAPLRSDFAVGFHSEAQIEPLRDATLRLLERTGVRYASPKALAILAKAGAKVDEASGARPPARASWSRRRWPARRARSPLGARDASCDLAVGSGCHLRHHRRLRRRGRRLAHRRAAQVHQGRPRGGDAHAGLPRLHLVLVADGERRRLRRDRPAARDRGGLEQHEQAPHGHGAGRDARHGAPSRWRRRWPAGPRSSAAGRS